MEGTALPPLFERKYRIAIHDKHITGFHFWIWTIAGVLVIIFGFVGGREKPLSALPFLAIGGFLLFGSTVAYPRMEGHIRLKGPRITFRVVPFSKLQKKEVTFSLDYDLDITYLMNEGKLRFSHRSREKDLLLDGLNGADIEELIHRLRKWPKVKYSVEKEDPSG